MFVNKEPMMELTKDQLVGVTYHLNTLLDILSQFQTTFIDGCDRTGIFSPQIARNFRTLECEVFTTLAEVNEYIEHKKDKEETDV
jgi:hypothetical protein